MHKSERDGLNIVKINKLRNIRQNHGIAEIIGTILLIAIVICIFASIYIYVLSDPGPRDEAYVKIVGKLESGDIVFENRRGESLGLDTQVILSLGGWRYLLTIEDDSLLNAENEEDGSWDIGERLVYSEMNITGLQVESTIVDRVSKSIIRTYIGLAAFIGCLALVFIYLAFFTSAGFARASHVGGIIHTPSFDRTPFSHVN